MNGPKEWTIIFYDEYSEGIDIDMMHMGEPDVLIQAFLDLESNPEAVKVIIHRTTDEGKAGMPFAVINKVVP